MSATLINSTIILNEIITGLYTENIGLKMVNRQYDGRFGEKAALKPGTTLYARKPIEYTIRTGKVMDSQDTVEESIPITCSTQIGIDLPVFTSEDFAMKIDDFRERYIRPAISRMGAEIDKVIFQHCAENFYMNVGTPGTTPQTSLVVGQAKALLQHMNVNEMVSLAVNPDANIYLVDALKGIYNPQQEIAKHYKTGMIKTLYGVDVGMSPNIHRITCGTRTGSILIDDTTSGNIAEGMSKVNMDAFGGATQTVSKGEKFTIAGVYAINPESKVSTGALQQFTVTEDFTASGSQGEVSFLPALYSLTGTPARANVDALPEEDAAVTFLGTASTTYPLNIMMHKDAVTFVTADLPVPKNKDAVRDNSLGFSLRLILNDFDTTNDVFRSRLDMYYGISNLELRRGVAMWG